MSDQQAEPLILSAIQRRIIGVLIEKSYTTPDQYPLSINSILSGCNQKSNRDPVLAYREGEVAVVVQEVVHKGLAKLSDIPGGSRVNRFEHCVCARCGWAPREQAVLAELLLRGPQTVGELRTRATRMVPMPDVQYVQGILDELSSQDPPLVVALPRQPGRAAIRHAHTLYPEHEDPLQTIVDAATIGSTPIRQDESTESTVTARLDDLEERIAALESKLDSLTGS